MNRNIKEMQSKLFNLLNQRAGIDLGQYPKAQVFVTEEEYDALHKDVLRKATLRYGRGQIASIYEYKSINYLIVPELYENVSVTTLSPVDDIKEIGYVYIVENSISPLETATKEELEEHIFDDENVKDIQWTLISNYFPAYSIFQINDSLPENDAEIHLYLKRLCIALVCETKEIHQLPFDSHTLTAFMDIANSTDDNIPYDNILRSLLSYHWKFCFIDLYRCQERLLKLAWVEEFKQSMNSTLALSELHGKMSGRFMQPRERDNMQYLYNLLPQPILTILTKSDTSSSKADFVYDLRNKIVHFQRTDAEVDSISESDWNMIIRFVLETIPFLYGSFSQHIMELPDL